MFIRFYANGFFKIARRSVVRLSRIFLLRGDETQEKPVIFYDRLICVHLCNGYIVASFSVVHHM